PAIVVASVHGQGHRPVDGGGEQHQRAEPPVPPAVEDVAGGRQQPVLRARVGQRPVGGKDQQEEEEEAQRGERHAGAVYIALKSPPGPCDRLTPISALAYSPRAAPGAGVPKSKSFRAGRDWPSTT